MINYLDKFSSAAVFGSVARGDDDFLSDHDLLVVSEKKATTQNLEALRFKGFSPSAYTWSSLDSLARHRSLFLLHLKLESKIIKDSNSRLWRFLSAIEPSNDYSIARKQSVALASLTSGVPDTVKLKLWAADVLAVAVRNYLVAFAAERGRLIFGYNELVELAKTSFKLDSDAKQSLLDLRSWKATYRNKGPSMLASPSLDQIQGAQRVISSMVGVKLVGSQLSVQEFAFSLQQNGITSEPWYHAVRRYEGIYRAIDSQYFSQSIIEVIEQKIAAPSCYTNDGQVLWRLLRSYVRNAYLKSAT